MLRNQRSTPRLLPGLAQALTWLRQSLPPAERPPLTLIPLVVPGRTPRQRRIPAHFAHRTHRDRFRPD
jgi:hypothetical protein